MHAESSSLSWFDKLASCCGPPSPRLPQGRNKLLRRGEKDAAIWSDEPALTPPPSFGPHPRPVDLSQSNQATRSNADSRRTQWPSQEQIVNFGSSQPASRGGSRGHSRAGKSSRDGPRSRHGYSRSGSSTLIGAGTGPPPSTGSRSSHSIRRRLRTSSSLSRFPLPGPLSASPSTLRPQISAPTNFRHLESGTFVFPALPQEEQQQIQQFQREQYHQMSQQQKQRQQEQQEQEFREQQQAFQQQYLQHYQEQYRQQYQQQFQRRPPSFRPLDFTTHLPSPLLPSFQRATIYHDDNDDNENDDTITMPPRVHTRNSSRDDELSIDRVVPLDRSHSAMSFHLPRRPVGATASTAGSIRGVTTNTAPAIPQRSRLRSHSSPAVENMVERIASAMIEMEKLQAEIDSVVERQSIYINSRPSTAYGMVSGNDMPPPLMAFPASFEEMPTVPAIPATAPSFAERLSTERPKTAPPRSSIYGAPSGLSSDATPAPLVTPSQPQHTATSLGSTTLAASSSVSVTSAASVASAAAKATKAKAKAAAALNSSTTSLVGGTGNSSHDGNGPRINGRPVDVPLAPPLPLVLRPPLRKKKSFSRVSNWLSFHNHNGSDGHAVYSTTSVSGVHHDRGLSFDSVTNMPRPVTVKDGFYTCLSPPLESARSAQHPRASIDSLVSTVDTLSTWTTEREEAERRQLADEEGDDDDDNDTEEMPRHDTPTPTSATTMTTLATLLTTATSTPTIPALAGMPSSAVADKTGVSLLSHRPQSVGVAF
ncbi:hypothetical protein SEUCBS140593_005589 [Sporothrix eucalyptigena]|uniref:Uncharacterized protein n=1 Tax=Sporothrix eucalyptigena TaxID=1812306 RepID=A0ABP0BZP2_9PEZI